ncbi:MAG: methionine adenosyltransferase [Sulfurimonas sp. RIFCSPHIGHO2_12_FULL_36_9]|uniref:methionine adenosyltransferase n=1 Tax=unclassified Sulfurimonas TaxID=2623549 RepID=UPI0008C3D171|nr:MULTISPECIES: methionine adenosyltransferase [unclassified Sulfurimonas]OHD98242.1 MAG: methionine adenosyltransferase [Sulfurimonas sp. RIFCSPLOWO2_02_FULL_36_28]OHD99579.1 MAG: methionine adenosyltransferase [Sulfurimonas sp. RIFCSPHIGHO2_12_FULL_36_9]OHE02574.1 MAG: methionine adenosyltransferase [Sulfurimonas sp. RIFCSPLOWO2_12_36_12]
MYLFTSEVVSPGHPDKCADIIADSIVDKLIIGDPKSRVASEVFVAGKHIVIGGEVTSKTRVTTEDYKKIVHDALVNIGYDGNPYFTKEECLHPEEVELQVLLNSQSPDINQGVDQEDGETGAGDQGIMFGYADIETKNFMPSAITYARVLMEKVYNFAKANPSKLGVDIKTQVTMDYGKKDNFENCKPQKIHTIVVSAPCVNTMDINTVRKLIGELIDDAGLPSELYNKNDCIIHINPTGKYVSHSSLHDSGLTGRKLIVDSFGGYAPIGGGAQSSKDYTKVDRSGLYAARYIAKHIVAAGLAKKALVQISYAIGVARPTSVAVDTYGTVINGLDDDKLSEFVLNNFSLTPNWITRKFNLDHPSKETFLYADVAARGQVGQSDYPWEQLDEVEKFEALK